jgi:hypothetical protein
MAHVLCQFDFDQRWDCARPIMPNLLTLIGFPLFVICVLRQLNEFTLIFRPGIPELLRMAVHRHARETVGSQSCSPIAAVWFVACGFYGAMCPAASGGRGCRQGIAGCSVPSRIGLRPREAQRPAGSPALESGTRREPAAGPRNTGLVAGRESAAC